MAIINVGIPKKKISSSVSIVVFMAKLFLWFCFFHKMLKNILFGYKVTSSESGKYGRNQL